ncbi:MAG: VWA domain-containing protein [Victivallaceae bacterium]|nr:VWA domain-containing protein [Victivallaceae bacterium]
MFSFTHPYLLLLLPAVPAVMYYIVKVRKRPSLAVASAEPFGFARRNKSWVSAFVWSDWFYLAAFTLVLIALTQPRWGTERFVVRAEGIDIVLALDLSQSMSLYDAPPGVNSRSALISGVKDGEIKDRIAVAKEALIKFVEARPNDRFGLIGFAQAAYNFAPPTLDHKLIIAYLDALEPGALRTGSTGIASPIISGVRRLAKSSAPRRVLVLFTDGVNNVKHAATPLEAAELAKAKDVAIYTVGIGSGRGFTVYNDFGGLEVEPVPDGFDEPLLREIAGITGGRYFTASDGEEMTRVMNEINKLEKTSAEQPVVMDYRHFAPNLALLALILTLAGFTLESTVRLRLP